MPRPGMVSVTVVTYNSGRFIKRCLESALEQKYTNFEALSMTITSKLVYFCSRADSRQRLMKRPLL